MKKLALLLAASLPFHAAFSETLHVKDEGLYKLRDGIPPGHYLLKGDISYTGQGEATVAVGISNGDKQNETFIESFIVDVEGGGFALLDSEIYVAEGTLSIDAYFEKGGEIKIENISVVSAAKNECSAETKTNSAANRASGAPLDPDCYVSIFEAQNQKVEEDSNLVKLEPVSFAGAGEGTPALQGIQTIGGTLSVEGMESLVLSLAPGEYQMGLISPQGGGIVLRAEGNVVIKGF